MKSLLYIALLTMVMIFVPSTIGVSSIANSQTLGVSEERMVELYIKSSPSSFQMYHYINKYAEVYKVPLPVAYKIARLETNYKNPLNFRYDHKQISSMNAYGPMQILLSTARDVSGDDTLTKESLLNDIELNVMLSMKYMRQLYDAYHDWSLAAGYYNTGRPQLNDYALAVREVINNGN